ncbi:MAG: hypothetical protein Q7R98_00350 [Candidatus Jorgensenbacteria bacterium]|nr:hypothetical protein [Candidatus Jorgensenbacteria bacterium]
MDNQECSRREISLKRWRTAVSIVFASLFLLSPFIRFVLERSKVVGMEYARITSELPVLRLQLDSLSRWFDGKKVFSPDEFVSATSLAIILRMKFEEVGCSHEAGTCQYLINQTRDRLFAWAEHNDVEFQKAMAFHTRLYGKNIDTRSEFMRSGVFIDANRAVNNIAFGGVPIEIKPESFLRLGKWAGRMYLYFFPFGLLILIGNLYLYRRSLKAQLVYGWWKTVVAGFLSPFSIFTFGERDYFEDKVQEVCLKLYPGCWYHRLSTGEIAKARLVAMESLAKVDRTIERGTFAFVCALLLTFLSLPFCSVTKASEKKSKRDTVLVDSSRSVVSLPKSDPPPALQLSNVGIHGEIRGNFSEERGEYVLTNAIVSVAGLVDSVRWKIEHDWKKQFLRCAQISWDFFGVTMRAGSMPTNWLFANKNQSPHSHAAIGGTPLAALIPLYGSGIEGEVRSGLFLSSLAYIGKGYIGRIQYGTSALKGNVVGFVQKGVRKIGLITDYTYSLFEAHPVLVHEFNAVDNPTSWYFEGGISPVSGLYIFGAREKIQGKFRNIAGLRFAASRGLFLKLNYFNWKNATAEFSFAF